MQTHNRPEERRRKSAEINQHLNDITEERREEESSLALEGRAEMALVRRAMGWGW